MISKIPTDVEKVDITDTKFPSIFHCPLYTNQNATLSHHLLPPLSSPLSKVSHPFVPPSSIPTPGTFQLPNFPFFTLCPKYNPAHNSNAT